MSLTKEAILDKLKNVIHPVTGNDLVSADVVRAVTVDDGKVRFVLEVDPAHGQAMEPARLAAIAAVEELAGAGNVSAALTAHTSKAAAPPPPNLKIGRHPEPTKGPEHVPGIDKIVAIASGKGGVGKSTVSANLAVALAAQGKRVGLLDADFYGPSQPRMMGVEDQRPASPDGKMMTPLHAHGVTMMSLGVLTKPGEAVVWRGPMLMGALQQMLTSVQWGELDVLIIDLPPGTGDVQLSLSQKAVVEGAIVVSTPQDVALLDARKAMDMFRKTGIKVLGMIENMSGYICPKCGHEAHIFGHGGAQHEAETLGLPFLGAVPLDLSIRLAGDGGAPIVAAEPDSPQAQAFVAIAKGLIDRQIV